MGQGGGTISIDGVVPASLSGATGGGWGWLDDTTCAGQADLGTGYLLRQLVLPNTLTTLDATATGTTDAAQNFRAGGSEWAAWMSGGVLKGTRSATVPFTGGTTVGTCTVLSLTGLGDIDETGRVYVIQSFSTDTGIVAYAGSGARLWTSSTSVLDGNNRLRAKNGSVAYQDTTSAWHLANATTGVLQPFAPRTDEVVAAMVPVLISGTIYVVELTNTQLTIRPATSGMGFVLATSANLFNPDAVSLSAGTVRVGWSVTTGENPTDLRLVDLTIASGTNSTGTTASGSLVITPGTALGGGSFAIGPVEGQSSSIALQTVLHHPVVDPKTGLRMTQPWAAAMQGAFSAAGGAVNVNRLQGVVPPAQGGTGVTTGLTVLNGGNLIPETVTYPALASDAVARMYAIASLRI
jgi:hypothetical protein